MKMVNVIYCTLRLSKGKFLLHYIRSLLLTKSQTDGAALSLIVHS